MEEPGEYTVGIRFNEKHIPGSPYKVYIQVMKQTNGSILLFESIKCTFLGIQTPESTGMG